MSKDSPTAPDERGSLLDWGLPMTTTARGTERL